MMRRRTSPRAGSAPSDRDGRGRWRALIRVSPTRRRFARADRSGTPDVGPMVPCYASAMLHTLFSLRASGTLVVAFLVLCPVRAHVGGVDQAPAEAAPDQPGTRASATKGCPTQR